MSYLVFARKYRPSAFDSVSGQEHVTRTLANAIRRDRVVHAYIFTGPRGVGKTSVARILAKALNCEKGPTPEPCLECSNCREIAQGSSMAVREIDGASHNSVDNVRELLDSFKMLPPSGYRYKVYIIDEVHMLSISAFNALLKSLEEPPPNTVFILATTEIHKIPETVLSRCQRHDFRALPVQVIEGRLRQIIEAENLQADAESLRLIARLADGSMRDAQTLLDRVNSFCTGTLTVQETSQALGVVERRALIELLSAVTRHDSAAVLSVIGEIFATGVDPSTVLKEFVNVMREAFLGKFSGESGLRKIGLSDDAVVEIMRLIGGVAPVDVQDLWDVAREGADRCARSSHPRLGLEALCVRLATRVPVEELASLIERAIEGTPAVSTAAPSHADTHQGAVTSTMPATSKASPGKPNEEKPAVPRPESPRVESPPISGASHAVSSPQVVPTVRAPGGVNADELMRFVSESAGRVFSENFKRLRVVRFESGTFEATGPEFGVNMLMKEKGAVEKLLQQFAASRGEPQTPWRVSITKGPGAADAAGGGADRRTKPSVNVEEHPALQSLQKVFPGSKVENVKIKN